MATQSKNKQQNHFQDSFETGGNEVVQQATSLSKDAIRSMWEDFFKSSAKQTLPDQLLNTRSESPSTIQREAVLQEGQEFSLIQKPEKKAVVTTEHREYVRSLDKSETSKTQDVETTQRVELLQMEIKKLIKASKEMEIAFKHVSQHVTVSSNAETGSKYEVNFLEWVLLTVRNARMRVEEGKNWLALFASKKGQQQYWSQASKKGTSFMLSSERTVATQTG